MGIFDDITCQVETPNLGLRAEFVFQAKSHFYSREHHTITRDLTLVETCVRSEWSDSMESGLPQIRGIPLGDRNLPYHGDLRIKVYLPGEYTRQVIARFTNGQLEWIRRFDDLPEELQTLLGRIDG